jgi:hypothetical protein
MARIKEALPRLRAGGMNTNGIKPPRRVWKPATRQAGNPALHALALLVTKFMAGK